MPEKREYSKERSLVTVTYTDGEVVEYPISASTGITRYLAENAGMTGVLSLMDYGATSVCIPLSSVRNWTIEPEPAKPTKRPRKRSKTNA